MNNQEMIARYLYAATKDLPAGSREDVSRELESLIDDILAERCEGRAAGTEELKAVLAEIGTPDEVYARYSPDGAQSLIGPPYFAKYKTVLRIVLYCVGLSMLVLGLVSLFTTPVNPWTAVSGWIGTVVSGLVFGFAAVTILFAVLQRKNVPLETEAFDFASLPSVPDKNQTISRGGAVAEIILNIVFTVVLIFFPQLFSFYWQGQGNVVFNVELLQSRWLLLVIACALGLAGTCFGMFEGRYTMRYAFVLLGCNIGGFIATALFLSGPSIINPGLLAAIGATADSEAALTFFGYLNYVILAAIALALILETVTAFGKALKTRV